jgi:high-affinity iron transporter
LGLIRAADELNKKGVTDGAHLNVVPTAVAEAPAVGETSASLKALAKSFDSIRALADQGDADEAASAMTDAYWTHFEPMERFIHARRPQEIRPLELAFNAVRGELGGGLRASELSSRLEALHGDVRAAIERCSVQATGTFAPAFGASLVTILREGVEVILLLTMLITLAAKTRQAGALRSIAWGVGLGFVASVATAIALNLAVNSAKARLGEVVEGAVMLAAAGVLFYVSYWLIAQSESKRWMDFLKRQAARGIGVEGPAAGGAGGFAFMATAFLAVYREGAETALMYQAMIGTQAGSRAGLSGLAAGLCVGLVLLAAVAYLVRATSVRLPLRAFFQVTGGVLFAMAVVFAGNGVFALQESGLIKTTTVFWLGRGLPVLGVHPSLQVLSVQGLLLAGAALALAAVLPGSPAGARVKPTAGVGV